MLVPSLRTVGNIVIGDDLQTQVIINCGALSCLLHLLKTSQKKSIKKEACWTISNITAGARRRGCAPPAPQRVPVFAGVGGEQVVEASSGLLFGRGLGFPGC